MAWDYYYIYSFTLTIEYFNVIAIEKMQVMIVKLLFDIQSHYESNIL